MAADCHNGSLAICTNVNVPVHRILHLLGDCTAALRLIVYDDEAAAYPNTMQVVRELLGLGVFKDGIDSHGHTALQLAARARSIEASCRQQAALYRWCQMLFSPNCAHLHRRAESLPDSFCCPSRIERRDLSRFMLLLLHPVVRYVSKFYLVLCQQFSMPRYHQHTAAMRTESRLLYTVTYSRLEPRSSLHDLEVHVILVRVVCGSKTYNVLELVPDAGSRRQSGPCDFMRGVASARGCHLQAF